MGRRVKRSYLYGGMMSYRTLIKTTKRTEYNCLKCGLCEILFKTAVDIKIKCNATDRAFMNEFSARHFTCSENANINKLTKVELDVLRQKNVKSAKDKFALKGKDAEKYEQVPLFKNAG